MAKLDWNKLMLNTIFSIYYFLLSWRYSPPVSLSVQLNHLFFTKAEHQEYKLKIYQTIATNNIVILNTNQIKGNTYPDSLKESNLHLKDYY